MATPTKQPTRSQLIKKADKYFSLAIRYRDGKKVMGDWFTPCITCEKWGHLKQMHAGHFQSRRHMATRYDDENVNGQCSGCNTFRYGEQYKYSVALDKKYGRGTAKRLAQKARETVKLTSAELLQIIEDAKATIKFYEKEN